MSSSQQYFAVCAELEMVKARALLLLMSDEVGNVSTGLAGELFNIVGDMTLSEAQAAIKEYEATQ